MCSIKMSLLRVSPLLAILSACVLALLGYESLYASVDVIRLVDHSLDELRIIRS